MFRSAFADISMQASKNVWGYHIDWWQQVKLLKSSCALLLPANCLLLPLRSNKAPDSANYTKRHCQDRKATAGGVLFHRTPLNCRTDLERPESVNICGAVTDRQRLGGPVNLRPLLLALGGAAPGWL